MEEDAAAFNNKIKTLETTVTALNADEADQANTANDLKSLIMTLENQNNKKDELIKEFSQQTDQHLQGSEKSAHQLK